jgi:hypothetical protein
VFEWIFHRVTANISFLSSCLLLSSSHCLYTMLSGRTFIHRQFLVGILMKRSFVIAILLVLFMMLVGGVDLKAQLEPTPYLAKEGMQTAAKAAKDSLASDAVLIYIGTFGDFEAQGVTTKFDLNNGKASVWGYVYYSPSLDKSLTIVVVKVLIVYQAFVVSDLPLPVQPADESVDVSGSYANSDKLVQRLKTDTAFTRYHSELPDARPDFVSYGATVPDNPIPMPDGFPNDEPLWTVSFIGSGDSTMTCFVAANTGTTICQRISLPQLSVDDESNGLAGTAALAVSPNPATGRTHIAVSVPYGMSAAGAEMVLFNALGEKVLDLSESFARTGYSHAEFDASTLPAGRYFCRVAGTQWNGSIGVVVGQ